MPLGARPIYWSFALIYVGGSRFLVRRLLNFRWSNGMTRASSSIYGAGGAGVQLATGLARSGAIIQSHSSTTASRCKTARSTASKYFPPRICRTWYRQDLQQLIRQPQLLPAVRRHRRQETGRRLPAFGGAAPNVRPRRQPSTRSGGAGPRPSGLFCRFPVFHRPLHRRQALTTFSRKFSRYRVVLRVSITTLERAASSG